MHGFTLLEVMVAATIAAVLVAVVAAALAVGVEGWRRGTTSAGRRVQAAAVLERMTEELQEAVRLGGVPEATGRSESCFAGDGESVRWMVRQDGESRLPGLMQVQYRYDPERRVLQRRSQMIEEGRLVGESAWSIIWQPLSGCAFRFPYEETVSGPGWTGGDLVWRDEWRQTDRLPAAVRIVASWGEGEAGDGDTETWERIVVIPHGVVGNDQARSDF